MLQNAQNQLLEDMISERNDKRKDEETNPKPAQPKAKTTTGWTQDSARWTGIQEGEVLCRPNTNLTRN